MLVQKPKIVFYAQRSFGEKMNASFDFIKENWKVMLKYITYFILPLCLIQSLSMNSFFSSLFDLAALGESNLNLLDGNFATFAVRVFVSYGFFMLCVMVGNVLMTSLIYGLMQLYNEREERLEGITFNDLRPYFFKNIKRSIILSLFFFALMMGAMLIIGIMTAVTPFLLILSAFGLLAVAIPLTLFLPIYLFEKISLTSSLGKSIRIGFATWGGIFAITFVMGFIGSILQTITMMPWYILFIVKYFLMLSDASSEVANSVLYNFGIYLLAILQSFGMYLSMVFTYIGVAYQYSHATEKIDNVSIESDIDNFEQL